jgi:hypothetical protein
VTDPKCMLENALSASCAAGHRRTKVTRKSLSAQSIASGSQFAAQHCLQRLLVQEAVITRVVDEECRSAIHSTTNAAHEIAATHGLRPERAFEPSGSKSAERRCRKASRRRTLRRYSRRVSLLVVSTLPRRTRGTP